MESESKRSFQDLSDHEIRGLVESLNSLHEGELGISMLVACGERAVPALRDFLLYGRPSGVFLPRQRAVRALAELGAKDTLLQYLSSERRITDPVASHGEEAVKNTAARALAAWRTDDVFHILLAVMRKKPLSGVIETLGEFGRCEAVPDLISALEDSFHRSFAEEALRKIGAPARLALVEAARTPDPSGASETPSSRGRRKSALRLLKDMQLSSDDWGRLAALLHDRDPEIAARAAAIGLAVADELDNELAIRRLLEALPTAGWLLQGEVQTWLEEHFDIARSQIQEQINHRQSFNTVSRPDNTLRLLLSIVRRQACPEAV